MVKVLLLLLACVGCGKDIRVTVDPGTDVKVTDLADGTVHVQVDRVGPTVVMPLLLPMPVPYARCPLLLEKP